MKKITSTVEFMAWAKSVNNNCNTGEICDLQDIYAHSDIHVINDLFYMLETNDKHLVIFSVFKAMGNEIFLNFIKDFSRRKAEEKVDEIIKEKQAIQSLIDAIKIDNERLKKEKDQAGKNNIFYIEQINNLMEENNKLYSEIDGARKEINGKNLKILELKAKLYDLQNQ